VARACLSTTVVCQVMSLDDAATVSTMPTATVALVSRSIMMSRRVRGCRRNAPARSVRRVDGDAGDVVDRQRVGGDVVVGVDVDAMADARAVAANVRSEFQQIAAAGEQRGLGEPDQMRIEPVGHRHRRADGKHIATRDVDLLGQRQLTASPGPADGRRPSMVTMLATVADRPERRRWDTPSRGRRANFAGCDGARVSPGTSASERFNPLHGHANGRSTTLPTSTVSRLVEAASGH